MADPIYTSKIIVVKKDAMGDDADICDAARVSTLGDDADEYVRNETADNKLIRYLMNNKHGSPFEQGAIRYIVTAPIFVFWDHVRHRIGVSYNIESSRYRELRPTFFVADEPRTQTGKPGHYVMSPGTPHQAAVMGHANGRVTSVAWEEYQAQLEAGIAREQAMQILPMNTVISAYVQFNPRSLMNFLELRLGPARKEMQQLATEYLIHALPHWPETLAAFTENGRVAP
jgi:thymidylate synthase (FAD)